MNLDELQRLAEGATPGSWFTDQYGLGVYVGDYAVASLMTKSGAHRNHEMNAEYIAAMSPDTAKKLIAVARAAQAAYAFIADQGKAVFAHGGMPAIDRLNATALSLRTALEELK